MDLLVKTIILLITSSISSLAILLQSPTSINPQCPPYPCDQTSCILGIIQCDVESHLTNLPIKLPRNIQKIILRYQLYTNPHLSYNNFSNYGPEYLTLKTLILTHSKIKSIQKETFSHLMYLTYLDLSYNEIKIIVPDTFKNLNLESLILSGNLYINSSPESFAGLVVRSLYLKNCSLYNINYETISELSGYLENLDISYNNLKSINQKFQLLLKHFKQIHLNNNPFNCSCQLRWLSETLNSRRYPIKNPPKCHYPSNLNGVNLTTLLPSSFYCPIPKIERIDLKITSSKSAELSCISDQITNSKVKWRYKKYLKSINYYQYEELIQNHYATIKVLRQAESDIYTCLIFNDNGNSTVDIKIKWPLTNPYKTMTYNITTKKPIKLSKPSSTTSVYDLNSQIPLIISNNDNKNINYLWLKQYTFIEMILAICGTFITTILTFIVLFLFINYRRRRKSIRTKNILKGYEVGIYSDSQTYDIPQLSPYHESNNGRLLDFKTQQEILRSDW